MVECHRTRFVPDHALIAFAGDITLAAAKSLVESRLGAWKKAGVPKPAVADPAPIGSAKGYLIARPTVSVTTAAGTTRSHVRGDAFMLRLGAVYSLF